MVRREQLHQALAQAIAKYAPSCRNPILLRRTITRDDLAREFNICYDTTIALADWTAAIEHARLTTQQHGSDPKSDHRIRQVESIINDPSFKRLSPDEQKRWLDLRGQPK